MKLSLRSSVALVSALVLAAALATAQAEEPAANAESFPGVKKALSPPQYAAAGLAKLSPEERANLDNYLRSYFSGATQQVVQQAVAKASAQAVDRAVKENRVEPPQLIESKIIGSVNGWTSRGRIFALENGQYWKTTDNESRYFPAVTNPDVFLVKDIFGYKMAIAGGGVTRVIRVK